MKISNIDHRGFPKYGISYPLNFVPYIFFDLKKNIFTKTYYIEICFSDKVFTFSDHPSMKIFVSPKNSRKVITYSLTRNKILVDRI